MLKSKCMCIFLSVKIGIIRFIIMLNMRYLSRPESLCRSTLICTLDVYFGYCNIYHFINTVSLTFCFVPECFLLGSSVNIYSTRVKVFT